MYENLNQQTMSDLKVYDQFFKEVIDTINAAKYEAYKSLNKHHIGQNFDLGKIIVENQEKNNWGKSIVENLCELISQELSKHIDFEDYNSLSEYQQGRLIGKVATYIVESKRN